MTEQVQHWIERWNRLKPSPTRDIVIKMWGGEPLKPKRDENTNTRTT